MYVNVHFDALFSFYGKRPVLSSLSSVPEPVDKESTAAFKERQKQIKELDKQKDKLEEYNRKLAALGNRNSYSKTDKDSAFMHMKEDAMRNGQTKPVYNLQTSTENQFITDFAFYPNPADMLTMPSFLASFKERYGHFASVVIADSGYGSEENYRYMEENDMEAYVKYNRFHIEHRMHHTPNPFSEEGMYYNKEKDFYVCPMGAAYGTDRDKARKNRQRIYYGVRPLPGRELFRMSFTRATL